MTVPADELAARMQAGESPESLLVAMLPPPDAELVRLAAVPRRLDEQVLGVLLEHDGRDPKAALKRLEDLALVERVTGPGKAVRLLRGVRADTLLHQWRGGRNELHSAPSELAEISGRLATHFASRRQPVEALYHEFAADPAAAVAHFEPLYREADEAIDLTRCQALLRALEETHDYVPPEVRRLVLTYSARLTARTRWLDDWYRSTRFLMPEGSEAPFTRLLNGDSRVLELIARGGMGKTMHLRWLTAQRCVPLGIACARIDFDDAESAAAEQSPWLLLLDAADQLGPQIPGNPFADLVAQAGNQLGRLYPHRGAETPLPPSVDEDERIGRLVADLFRSAVEAMPDQRWVLILDTLEVAVLRLPPTGHAKLRMLEPLAELAELPSSRLVFAGRNEIDSRASNFRDLFPGAERLHLHGFGEPERAEYLRTRRRITNDALVEAASKVAGEMPLKLSLVADVIDRHQQITPEELRGYGDPDLLYLIQRVLERVDTATRWALRYGAVPRVLDLDFMREVAGPHIARSMAGDGAHDRVAETRLPGGRPASELLEPHVLESPDDLDIDEVWAGLRSYAGDSSWVRVPPGSPDEVRLHGDVVNPMRHWLAEQEELFDALQKETCEWFERRETAEPGGAERWGREAVFHRFQREGPSAASYWHLRMAAASRPDDAAVRLALAEDLLGADYVDENGPVTRRDGRPLIDKRTLDEARFEVVWANIQIARAHGLPATAPQWRDARDGLTAIESSYRDHRGSLVAKGRIAMARTALSIVDGDEQAAREHFRKAKRGWKAGDDLLWVWLEYGPQLAGGPASRFLSGFVLRMMASSSTDRGQYWARRREDTAARRDAAADRIDDALGHLEEAASHADPAQRKRAAAAEAALRLRTGENARVLGLLDEAQTVQDHLLVARARMRRLEAVDALGALERARQAPVGRAPGPVPTTLSAARLEAEAAELRGRVRATQLDGDGAIRAFLTAAELWGRTGSPEGTARAHARRAAFLLRSAGDVHDARIALASAEKAGPPIAGTAWTRMQVLRAQLAARSLRQPEAAAIIAETIRTLEEHHAPPRRMVTAIMSALDLYAEADRGKAAELLVEQLERVSPAGARLTLVGRLRAVEVIDGLPRRLRGRVRKLVPSARDRSFRDLDARDRAMLLVADADLHRVIGEPSRALAKLDEARDALVSDAVGLRVWLEALGRLGGDAARLETVRAQAEALLGDPEDRAATIGPRGGLAVALGRAAGLPLDPALERLLGQVGRKIATERGSGHWEAGIASVLARAARARGDEHAATEAARHAARVYQQLGDLAARDRVYDGTLDSGEMRPQVGDEALELTVSLDRDRFRVEARWGDAPPRSFDVAEPGLAADVAAVGNGWSRAVPHTLVAAVVDRREDLTDRVLRVITADGALAEAIESHAERDVRLRLASPALETVPWELAATVRRGHGSAALGALHRGPVALTVDVAELRSVQLGLRLSDFDVEVDGTHGPATTAAIEAFQAANGFEVTGRPDPRTVQALQRRICPERSVTVVRGGARRPLHLNVPLVAPVERLYSAFGFNVQTAETPHLDELIDVLRLRPTMIVHVTAPLVETGGSVALDVVSGHGARPDREGAATECLTAAALDRAFQGPLPAPIVILDPPRPASEVARSVQLLLRNAFAGELFALGTTRAVFGVGLAALESQDTETAELLGSLAAGERFGDVVRAMRSHHAGATATLHTRSGELLPPW